jgi:RES domain-containing protein
MVVYRIARERWISNRTGSGAPGRWNNRNVWVLYTASSIALALLEILVHLRRDQLPADYMWVSAEIDDQQIQTVKDMPPDTAEYGSAWARAAGSKLSLGVPSVIVPELNFILNPDHTDFSSVMWSDAQPLKIDPRLTTLAESP